MKNLFSILVCAILAVGSFYEYRAKDDLQSRVNEDEKTLAVSDSELKQTLARFEEEKQLVKSMQTELDKAKVDADRDHKAYFDLMTKMNSTAAAPAPVAPVITPAPSPTVSVTPTAPATSVLAASTTPAKALTPDTLQSLTPCLAILEGKEGSGSGFLAQTKNGTSLITNAHVLNGNENIKISLMNGSTFTADSVSLAQGFDLVSLTGPSTIKGLEILQDVAGTVSVGDDVAVLGNSQGAGVATQLLGKIKGIGPSLIEVDAEFVPGNSGSPVIHLKTGKVIGVATYMLITKNGKPGQDASLAQPVVRRFAYRLDTVQDWKPLNYQEFQRQAALCDAIEAHTKDLFQLARDITAHNRLNYEAYYGQKNTLKDLVKDFEVVATDQNLSQSSYSQAKKSFLFFVLDSCQKDLTSVIPSNLDSFHQADFKDQHDDRDSLTEYFQHLYDGL